MEKKMVKILKYYPEERLILCENEHRRIFAKGFFSYPVYPEENIYLYGEFRSNKKLGRYFDIWFYRDHVDDFWIAKWLKLHFRFSNKDIIHMILQHEFPKQVRSDFKNFKIMRRILTFLLKEGVSLEIISQIERDFQWRWNSLLLNPLELLRYPEISESIFEKTLQHFFHSFSVSEAHSSFFLNRLLKKSEKQGHLFLPENFVRKQFEKRNLIFNPSTLVENSDFVFRYHRFFLKKNFDVEKNIVFEIKKRFYEQKEEKTSEFLYLNQIKQWEEKNFPLAPNQKKAVLMALKEKISIITGGPGVGKTTVCKCITDLLSENQKVSIAAPTGRAAKRAFESTGIPANTLHRTYGYTGHSFEKNSENPIEADVLIFDESSMIDVFLLEASLLGTPHHTKIIFVGDVDQLPSVGPGQILRDLIESNSLPVTKLTDIFRQAADSPIITCAYAINQGELPVFSSSEDLIFLEEKTESFVAEKTLQLALDLYQNYDLLDVQVLIPIYKGPLGIDFVNQFLQEKLNPSNNGSFLFREGDKVIQKRNNYEKGIYNGDVGLITFCSDEKVKVHFPGHEKNEIVFHKNEIQELQLSYATSVHRSQGSEYPYVVLPLVSSYRSMLQKNLVYTGVTRAKKRLWIPFERQAFQQAVRLDSVPLRYTTLKGRLSKIQKIA